MNYIHLARHLLSAFAFYVIVVVEVVEQTISWRRICSDVIALVYAINLGERPNAKLIALQIVAAGLADGHVICRLVRDIRERIRRK
jgi:hypothetical protein